MYAIEYQYKTKVIIYFSPYWEKFIVLSFKCNFPATKKNKFISGKNSNKYTETTKNSFQQNALTHHKPPPKN